MGDNQTEDLFLRDIRRARLRYLSVATFLITATVIFLASLSPVQVGTFAYYSISALLGCAALLSLVQCRRIVRPIQRLLVRLKELSLEIDSGNLLNIQHLNYDEKDEFSYLASEVDRLIEKLASQTIAKTEQAQRNQDIVSACPQGLIVLNRTGKVTSLAKQPTGEEPLRSFVVGYSPDVRIWGRDNIDRLHHALEETFNGKGLQKLDIYTPGADDKCHHYHATLNRMTPFFALLTMTDVTTDDESFLKRQHVQRNEDAASRRDAIIRFAAGVGHDVKNIFTILSNLTVFRDETMLPLKKKDIETARDAIRRGTDMMRELMSFAGEARYILRRSDTRAILQGFYANPTLRALIPANIILQTEMTSERLPEVEIDADQFWKVGLNLIKNAVEAIGSATGIIRISTTRFEMTEETAVRFINATKSHYGPGVIISFFDDGPGIPENAIDKIFEPYYSNKENGRGLGLASVRAIVEAHNGLICVTSQKSHGTHFEIFLPESRRSCEEADMIKSIAPGGEILVIDDDAAILRTTKLLLGALKITAHPANNAHDAIHKFRSLAPRLKAVVLDAHLQMNNTTQLLCQIRSEDPSVPVIISSGASEKTIREIFRNTKFDYFLEKPFSVRDIAEILNRIDARNHSQNAESPVCR